jgi:uncharacterized protein with GYD domain
MEERKSLQKTGEPTKLQCSVRGSPPAGVISSQLTLIAQEFRPIALDRCKPTRQGVYSSLASTSSDESNRKGDRPMPTYITLGRWTQQGIEKVKDSPARLDAFKQLVKSAGGEVKGFYMVTGQYDIVIISEAPNDDAMAKTALATASKGGVKTETLRAFTEDEYRKIVAALP